MATKKRSRTGGSLFQESLALFQEVGNTRGSAWALSGLGNVARLAGDTQRAHASFEASWPGR